MIIPIPDKKPYFSNPDRFLVVLDKNYTKCHLSDYNGPGLFTQYGPAVFVQTGPAVFTEGGPLVFGQTGPPAHW